MNTKFSLNVILISIFKKIPQKCIILANKIETHIVPTGKIPNTIPTYD